MTILYVSCPLNQLAVVQVDDTTGDLVRTVQTVAPVVDPLPEDLRIDNGMTEWISVWNTSNHNNNTERETDDDNVTTTTSLLYALTSFWNKAHAVVTAYSINPSDGTLSKLGASVSTQGYQAASGAFSADGSTYVVGHHNCGTITVLSVFEDGPPVVLTTLQPPVLMNPLRASNSTSKKPHCAAIHHVQYFHANNSVPDCLVVTDCAQDAAILYPVDDMGHFDDRPLAHVHCRPHAREATTATTTTSSSSSSTGWIQRLFRFVMTSVLQLSPQGFRLRRAVLSSVNDATLVYCLGELTNTIQVYRLVASSTTRKTTSIDPSPLQELVVAGHSLQDEKYIGLGITIISEFQLYSKDRMALVGVRGVAKLWGSKAEHGIRVLHQLDDGRLELGQWIPTPASVRHFDRRGPKLYVGINAEEYPYVQTYTLQEDGLWTLSGQANVGMDVFCVVPF